MWADHAVVVEAERAYELQIQVVKKLKERAVVDPYRAGLSSLSSAIRFAALFKTLDRSAPFLTNAVEYLREAYGAGRVPSGGVFNPEVAYRRMRVSWGLFGLSELRSEENGEAYLRSAFGSLEPAFSQEWIVKFQANIEKGVEDTKSASVVQLAFLGFSALLRMGGHDVSTGYVDRALSLRVSDAYRPIRTALADLVVAPGQDASTKYRDAYQDLVSLGAYRSGLVAGLTFVEVWLLAAVREEGNIAAAATNLFLS